MGSVLSNETDKAFSRQFQGDMECPERGVKKEAGMDVCLLDGIISCCQRGVVVSTQ